MLLGFIPKFNYVVTEPNTKKNTEFTLEMSKLNHCLPSNQVKKIYVYLYYLITKSDVLAIIQIHLCSHTDYSMLIENLLYPLTVSLCL